MKREKIKKFQMSVSNFEDYNERSTNDGPDWRGDRLNANIFNECYRWIGLNTNVYRMTARNVKGELDSVQLCITRWRRGILKTKRTDNVHIYQMTAASTTKYSDYGRNINKIRKTVICQRLGKDSRIMVKAFFLGLWSVGWGGGLLKCPCVFLGRWGWVKSWDLLFTGITFDKLTGSLHLVPFFRWWFVV